MGMSIQDLKVSLSTTDVIAISHFTSNTSAINRHLWFTSFVTTTRTPALSDASFSIQQQNCLYGKLTFTRLNWLYSTNANHTKG